MRLKIPIFVEISARPSPKEVEVLRSKLNDLFTLIIKDHPLVISELSSLGKIYSEETQQDKVLRLTEKLKKLLPYIKSQEIDEIEILDKTEFINRIR